MIRSQSLPLVFATVVTLCNCLISLSFAMNGLVDSGFLTGDTIEVFAAYSASRALAIAAVALIVAWRQSANELFVVSLIATITQLLDAVIGGVQHDPGKTVGPLLIGIVQMAVTVWISRKRLAPKIAVGR